MREPQPDGKCLYCDSTLDDHRDPADGGWWYGQEFFCTKRCAMRDWQGHAEVPDALSEFKPDLAKCGADRITSAEDWVNTLPSDSKPGLVLYSRASGRSKTRLGTGLMGLYIGATLWRGAEYEQYRLELAPKYFAIAGIWINAPRFRKRYLETSSFSAADERVQWINDLTSCSFLMFDDIDKLKGSEGLIEMVHGILDERFLAGNTTILTMNSTPKELIRKWGSDYGPYIVRRLKEFSLTIDCD
jgi:hypothetical protein